MPLSSRSRSRRRTRSRSRSRRVRLTDVTRSPLRDKKLRAHFDDGTHVDFGARCYEDYTTHRDRARRERYRTRHANDNLDDPRSPGALSWWILWGPSTTVARNVAAYRRRFGA